MSNKLLPFVLLLFAALGVKSQDIQTPEKEKDFNLWGSVGIEKEFTKKLSVKLSEEIRLNNNASNLRAVFTDLGLAYKLSKLLEVSGNYRFIILPEEVKHRIYADFIFRKEIKDLSISYRLRPQKEFETNDIAENYIRQKLAFEYNIPKTKFTPFVAGELFYHLYYKGNQFDRCRFFTGVERKTGEGQRISLQYILENEFNVRKPVQSHIISVGYNYKIGRKKQPDTSTPQ